MAVQLSKGLHQLPLLAPLDFSAVEQNISAIHTLSPNGLGYITRKTGQSAYSPIQSPLVPSAAGEPLRVFTLDVHTPFSLPDGLVAVMPASGAPTDPAPTVTNFTATAS